MPPPAPEEVHRPGRGVRLHPILALDLAGRGPDGLHGVGQVAHACERHANALGVRDLTLGHPRGIGGGGGQPHRLADPRVHDLAVPDVDPVRTGPVLDMERSLEKGGIRPGPDHRGVCPVPKNRLKSVHDHRFSRSGLSRQDGQPRMQRQGQVLDNGEILYGKVFQQDCSRLRFPL